jgi:hypothetical protein
MAYEWGRLIWWLNQNAGAVQALCAVITVLLTVVLAGATIWYARLTSTLNHTAQRQLSAMLFPNLELSLSSSGSQGARGSHHEIGVSLQVSNKGQQSVLLHRMSLGAMYAGNIDGTGEVTVECDGQLIAAGAVQNESRSVEVTVPDGFNAGNIQLRAVVECTDVGRLSQHTFIIDHERGRLYYPLFLSEKKHS